MRDFLDEKLIDLKLRSRNLWQRLLTDEKGDTNFVAIIVLIVIIVFIAGIFKNQLKDAVDAAFGQLDGFIGGGGSTGGTTGQ